MPHEARKTAIISTGAVGSSPPFALVLRPRLRKARHRRGEEWIRTQPTSPMPRLAFRRVHVIASSFRLPFSCSAQSSCQRFNSNSFPRLPWRRPDAALRKRGERHRHAPNKRTRSSTWRRCSTSGCAPSPNRRRRSPSPLPARAPTANSAECSPPASKAAAAYRRTPPLAQRQASPNRRQLMLVLV